MLKTISLQSLIAALLVVAAPATSFAQPTPRGYTLTANEARALQAAFSAQISSGTSPAKIAAATVHIVEQQATVQLKFAWADGSSSTVNVDKRTHDVQPASPAISMQSSVAGAATETLNELAIPGEDAHAISAVLSGLSSGSLRLILPKGDFDSDRFTIQEHAAFSSPTGKPGYYVVYIPAVSTPCPKYTVYRVDPNTWQMFEQPHIC
jgi:hypothetical protein